MSNYQWWPEEGQNHDQGFGSPRTHRCVSTMKVIPSGPNRQKGYLDTSHRKCNMFHNTQCIIFCCLQGCVGADQTGYLCYPLSTIAKPTMDMSLRALDLDLGAITWSHFLSHWWTAPGCTLGRRQTSGRSMMLWAILAPTYLNITADQAHFFKALLQCTHSFWNGLRNKMKSSRYCLGLQIPQLYV